MRVVLDTNVLLAACATRGLCEALLRACLQAHEIVLSEHILAELREHLLGKLKVSARFAGEIDGFFREHAEIVAPAEIDAAVCADADDLPVLGTAVSGRVDVVVTGDRELLRLGEVTGIPILSPRAFYDRLR